MLCRVKLCPSSELGTGDGGGYGNVEGFGGGTVLGVGGNEELVGDESLYLAADALALVAHLLNRFSLCSQLCRTLCGCAFSFTSASMVSISGYACYTINVYVCQELFCTNGGQVQYSRTTPRTMPMISA